MTFWRKLTLLLPWKRNAADQDMREELASLEAMAGRGQLGNLTLAAEDARGELTWLSLERLAQDLRYGLRSMRRDKLFASLAIVSLALGIGANTAIFSFLESVLLRRLPVNDPQSLVVMKWQAKGYALATEGMSWSTDGTVVDKETGTLSTIFPYPALKLFEGQPDVLSSAFGYFATRGLSVTAGSQTDSLLGQYVSGAYFHGMGVTPAAGRLIEPADDDPAPAPVVVVSHRFSVRRFGGPEAAVGQPVRVNDQPLTIIGVAPDRFFGAEPGAVPDVYLPLHLSPMSKGSDHNHGFYWLEVMGRLRPGVSLAQAQARLAPAFQQFATASATTDKQRQDLPRLRLHEGATGLDSLRRKYATPIYVLMTLVLLMLAIACTNIASLLLARAATRRREIAIRLSLGASRGRVIRQLLTESILLSTAGGALGVALAWWGIGLLTALLSNGRDNFTLHADLNWTALSVTVALSVLTGIVFGLAPALQATRVDVAPALKTAGTQDAPRSSRRLGFGSALIVLQMAFSLLLLVAAGLFDRTLTSLHAIPLGFSREQVLLFTIRPSAAGYQGDAATALFETLRRRLQDIPGVSAVGLSAAPLPMGGGTMARISVDGEAAAESAPNAVIASVGPNFFATMQIPILAGREFTDRDDASAPRTAIVNRRFVTGRGLTDPLGRLLTMGQDRYQIVGVAENALSFSLKEDGRAAVYFSYLQSTRPVGRMTYELRAAGDPLSLAGPVRDVVRQVDSRLAIHDMKTQGAHIDQAISTEITLARLCSIFALIALVIACVGLYGIVAFNVARRTSEIGIRSALGASRRRIVWMIMRDVWVMALAGLAIGIPLVLAGSRYVKSFLYGVPPNDPVAIASAVAILLATALMAGFLPATRASRIDPLRALRAE